MTQGYTAHFGLGLFVPATEARHGSAAMDDDREKNFNLGAELGHFHQMLLMLLGLLLLPFA